MIKKTQEYNQGIGRYKLLSSVAGVGALVISKLGYSFLVSSIDRWSFMRDADKRVRYVKEKFLQKDWHENAKELISKEEGIGVVDDKRFIEFLRLEKEIPNLLCLIEIPHLSLNEKYNTVNKNNPRIIKTNKEANDFLIPASHFPKWFYNSKGVMKLYKEWFLEWKGKGKIELYYFAPPRDINSPKGRFKDGMNEKPLFEELTQTNMVLICSNGHLSDMPWSKYISLKRLQDESPGNEQLKSGQDLFMLPYCCTAPRLKRTESKTKSEGYSSIYVECDSCKGKYNLEGINNLRPICPGHKPWEVHHDGEHYREDLNDWERSHREECHCDNPQERRRMQIALVTGNNTYFANVFSSIYIPEHLAGGLSLELQNALKRQDDKFEMRNKMLREDNATELSKFDFANKYITPEKLKDDYREEISKNSNFLFLLKEAFIGKPTEPVVDRYEDYRWKEYQCFIGNSKTPESEGDIKFEDVMIPEEIIPFFKKIQKVENLKVSSVQLNFSRVTPLEKIITQSGEVTQHEAQDIFSNRKDDVLCLPSVQAYGEGIFFAFNEEHIVKWIEQHSKEGSEFFARLNNITREIGNDQGSSLREKLRRYGAKFLLIHSFSHLMMRELEFSCGYPTASLKERLYISDRMSGVLIYTAEGSEGSMGGIIWQTREANLKNLFLNALERADRCSSDPLCWESDGQGIFNLNLAACFSCTLVSETACEERNLCLDRRVLVDNDLGFFKDVT